MVVPDHTVVGTIVMSDPGFLRSNACLGGNIQIYIGVIIVYSPDLVKICRIHTLE